MVLKHLTRLGQLGEEQALPVQTIFFLSVELDTVIMTAHLSEDYAHSVLNCLNMFKYKTAVPLKCFQRLLGHITSLAAVMLQGLMYLRPLQL